MTKVDKSEIVDRMDNTGDPKGKVVHDPIKIDSVACIGNKEVTSEEEEEEAEEPGLDKYLDNIMVDMTMSHVKAKKAGDLVANVVCSDEIHKVDLKAGTGFFLIACADLARKTAEGMLAYADSTQDIQGCVGHSDCIGTLAEAIENSEMPDEVFCYEGTTKHLTGLDEPCMTRVPPQAACARSL